jgi:hypothetical protein
MHVTSPSNCYLEPAVTLLELLGSNVLLDEELPLLLIVTLVTDKVGVDAPIVKAFGGFQEGVVRGVKTQEHLAHPVGQGLDRWVSIVRLSVDGCDVGGLMSLSPSQHFHFPVPSFLDSDGDHFISRAGGDGVSDIPLIAHIPLWDGDVFPLLVMDLACEVHNQLTQVAILLLEAFKLASALGVVSFDCHDQSFGHFSSCHEAVWMHQ